MRRTINSSTQNMSGSKRPNNNNDISDIEIKINKIKEIENKISEIENEITEIKNEKLELKIKINNNPSNHRLQDQLSENGKQLTTKQQQLTLTIERLKIKEEELANKKGINIYISDLFITAVIVIN